MDDVSTIRAIIAPAAGEPGRGVLHMIVPVTPYGVECLVDGALGGGDVVVELPPGASIAERARVEALVSVLRRWGLQVRISGGVVERAVVPASDQLPGRASG